MKFEIKSRWESKVLFSLETKSLKLCVEAAIKRGADLGDAYLRGADLSGATGFGLPYQLQTCPRSGSFEAWKKGDNQEIIKLTIPWWARRTANIVDRKCRAEIALVVAIYNKSGKPIGCCRNGTWADRKIDYRVGGFVRSRNYDASWLKNCSNGIHFFMTKEEAENW